VRRGQARRRMKKEEFKKERQVHKEEEFETEEELFI
jgi:hypothetical protein